MVVSSRHDKAQRPDKGQIQMNIEVSHKLDILTMLFVGAVVFVIVQKKKG